MTNDYIKINKSLWNNKVAAHYKSEFYNMAGFRKGESSLNSIELDLLGNVEGKSILHLQCHFGQDSISLAKSISTGASSWAASLPSSRIM